MNNTQKNFIKMVKQYFRIMGKWWGIILFPIFFPICLIANFFYWLDLTLEK